MVARLISRNSCKRSTPWRRFGRSLLVVTKACGNEKLWPLLTNEGKRRGGEGAHLGLECMISSRSGELAVVSALVGALGAMRVFGWCRLQRERAIAERAGRAGSLIEPYSGILSSAAEVISLQVQKPRLECAEALLKASVFELQGAGNSF